ncbi:Single-stranded DNA-binding protein [Gammaproteobacteria bacterium]
MLNKVTLIGRLGADPEVRYLASGDPVATISLATSRIWKDKATGERKEETEWHRVVFFKGTAKTVGEHLKKGSLIYVEGRIRTNKWQDNNGVDRYTTEIIAETMKFLESKGDGSSNRPPVSSYEAQQGAPRTAPAGNEAPPANYDDFDDDIPF